MKCISKPTALISAVIAYTWCILKSDNSLKKYKDIGKEKTEKMRSGAINDCFKLIKMRSLKAFLG